MLRIRIGMCGRFLFEEFFVEDLRCREVGETNYTFSELRYSEWAVERYNVCCFIYVTPLMLSSVCSISQHDVSLRLQPQYADVFSR